MSYAMNASRVGTRGGPGMAAGDPGLFGAITGAIKGLISGGPLGAISGAVSGWKTTGQAKQIAQGSFGNVVPVSRSAPLSTTMIPYQGPGNRFVGVTTPGGRLGFGAGAPTVGVMGGSMGGAGYYSPGTGVGPVRPRAVHPNKSGYWLKSGEYVAPGTRMVTNRRMNPLNPRSLSKSLRRVQGFAKASKGMRTMAGRIATQVAGPRRSSCTHKGKCK